jgi:xylulokinase
MKDILSVDVGTTMFKMGVYGKDLIQKAEVSKQYDLNIYDKSKADIDPDIWWKAFEESCIELKQYLPAVAVISFSVTTPGLVALDRNGNSLLPAILFMDGRSHEQAKRIRDLVGEEYFLRETCNLPVSGGSSLCSIMWIMDHLPDVWEATYKFGHCNTYMVRKLTGSWTIDPSTTSITGMYNTRKNNLTWNKHILSSANIPLEKLPSLHLSHHSAGKITPDIAKNLGFDDDTHVLVGGNDAVLASFSLGLVNPGDISNVHGTCDITSVCVDKPICSTNFNLRCHVIPNRWATFFVLNTGGKALDWFYSVFCKDMTREFFYNKFIPEVIGEFLDNPLNGLLEKELPIFIPYLQGSRYSTEMLTATYSKLTLATTREMMLLAMIKSNLSYQREHLDEVRKLIKLKNKIYTTGGGATIKRFLDAKERWTGKFDYELQEQSSLRGAAMLGKWHLTKEYSSLWQ